MLRSMILSFVFLALPAQAPLQVGTEPPRVLDLRDAAGADWVPRDARDPAQVEAMHQKWSRQVAPDLGVPAVRILLPAGPDRLPLLLAASQALKAQDPAVTLYLGFEAKAEPIWDESAWGAVQGGALLPEDLGADPGLWRDRLLQAQTQFPGRPWTLWRPCCPRASPRWKGAWAISPCAGPAPARPAAGGSRGANGRPRRRPPSAMK